MTNTPTASHTVHFNNILRQAISNDKPIDDIEGKNVVVGLRHVKNLAQLTQEELRQEVTHLRTLLEAAIEAGQQLGNHILWAKFGQIFGRQEDKKGHYPQSGNALFYPLELIYI